MPSGAVAAVRRGKISNRGHRFLTCPSDTRRAGPGAARAAEDARASRNSPIRLRGIRCGESLGDAAVDGGYEERDHATQVTADFGTPGPQLIEALDQCVGSDCPNAHHEIGKADHLHDPASLVLIR